MRINPKITSSIAGASVVLTLIGILSKGIGFIREIIYANNFGLSPDFDLFLTSAALPLVINSAAIFLCQHYFIPAFNKIKIESEEASHEFFNYTFWWFIFGGFIIAFLLFGLSRQILDFYLSSMAYEIKEQGQNIFLLFLLTIPINVGISVITAYLHANFNFIYPAVSQILLNVIVIILIILFTPVFQIFILPISFVIAYFIAFIILYFPIRKKLKFFSLSILKFKNKFIGINVFISLIFIEGLSLSYILIDRYFIGKIPVGGIAALNYALVIYLLPVTIISLPLITTIFTKFSKSYLDSPEILSNNFENATRISVFLILPITFLLIFVGDLFLKLFYERGEFTSAGTVLTHSALQCYSLGLVFYSSYLIAVKLLYSLSKYNLVLIISVIAFLLKIVFNFLFVDNLHQNGLALATAFIYIYLFFSGFILCLQQIKCKNKFFFFTIIIYFAINGTLSFLISYFFTILLIDEGVLFNIMQILIFIFVYIINSHLLNDQELKTIKSTVFNIVFGLKG